MAETIHVLFDGRWRWFGPGRAQNLFSVGRNARRLYSPELEVYLELRLPQATVWFAPTSRSWVNVDFDRGQRAVRDFFDLQGERTFAQMFEIEQQVPEILAAYGHSLLLKIQPKARL